MSAARGQARLVGIGGIAALALGAGCRERAGRDDAAVPARVAPTPCPIAAPPAFTGEATRYAGDGRGACSFDPTPDRRVAALSAVDYGRAAWCGACVEVTGPLGRVTVRVVDRCAGCAAGDLDLSRGAWAAIAAPDAGRVRVTWRAVPCEVEGPLRYQLKQGSHAQWAALQIRNHRYPIASLEARSGGGAWRALDRGRDNYFVAAGGLGAAPVSLRVTDTRGHVLEEPALHLPAPDKGRGSGGGAAPAAAIEGAAQLPRCPDD